ncbi:MAG: tol-pal system protein YbgF [Candidatus Acidiferrales bacterium]|jgi:tol-pal system protein YbgF
MPMRIRSVAVVVAAVFFGAMMGQMLAPQPAGAVSREIVELQQSVAQLLQGQQDLRSSMEQKLAELHTLVGQSLDSQNRLSTEMATLQKNMQDAQANAGAKVDTLATQSQGLSDNMQDLQARVGKVSQQVSDVQNLLQSVDAKIPGGTAGTTPTGSATAQPIGAAPSSTPPISSDTLYQNALRDYNSGRYDLSRQEFSDFLKSFPDSDLAGNSQFYLGEIDFSQANYQDALSAYDMVIVNYPKSYKLAAASLKKGEAMLALGQKASAIRQFRSVVSRFPGTDESKRAEARLKQLAPSPAH